MPLEVIVEDARWNVLHVDALAQTALRATLSHMDIDVALCEVSLLACDDARIAVLNADFRAKSTPTNVLSWPAEERGAVEQGIYPAAPEPGPDGMIELGDIAISYDTCMAEADTAGKRPGDHVTHLVAHATLHLLGYDHENARDAALMEGLEIEILGKLGLDNPYRES